MPTYRLSWWRVKITGCHSSACCVSGALLRQNMLMGALHSSLCNIYNRLINSCRDLRLNCHGYVPLRKHCHCLQLSLFLIVSFFVCVAADRSTQRVTTGVEDTSRTLTVILFIVALNNSLSFLLLLTYEKRFAEFPLLHIYSFLTYVFI